MLKIHLFPTDLIAESIRKNMIKFPQSEKLKVTFLLERKLLLVSDVPLRMASHASGLSSYTKNTRFFWERKLKSVARREYLII